MKVLVACEFSGIVREAFKARGHDAWSCDLLDTEIPAGNHYKGDIFDIINDGWDLMIAHPPCTYLSYAGTQVWDNPGRARKRLKALEFVLKLWEAPIEKICIENPKSCISPVIAKYTQEIQPYYFGDNDMKTTWLWLKNLSKLKHIDNDLLFGQRTHIDKPLPVSIDKTERKHKRYRTDGKIRNPFERARTFQGIANAMAEQWG